MIIELYVVQFGLKSYAWFEIRQKLHNMELCNPVWNCKFSPSDKDFCLQIFYWSISELVCRKLQIFLKLFFIFLQFDCFLCKQVWRSDWLLCLGKASLLASKICDLKYMN